MRYWIPWFPNYSLFALFHIVNEIGEKKINPRDALLVDCGSDSD
jgi:hypothetical protein